MLKVEASYLAAVAEDLVKRKCDEVLEMRQGLTCVPKVDVCGRILRGIGGWGKRLVKYNPVIAMKSRSGFGCDG